MHVRLKCSHKTEQTFYTKSVADEITHRSDGNSTVYHNSLCKRKLDIKTMLCLEYFGSVFWSFIVKKTFALTHFGLDIFSTRKLWFQQVIIITVWSLELCLFWTFLETLSLTSSQKPCYLLISLSEEHIYIKSDLIVEYKLSAVVTWKCLV